METIAFLEKVITAPEGHFILATFNGQWREQWFEWPRDQLQIVEAADVEYDCYFSSYLFDDRHSSKDHVLPSRTIQADLDNADILTIDLAPTMLVSTSRGRHQGYWLLDQALDINIHESLSKKVTYGIEQCDRSGWAVGRKVRLPNTLNCKYNDKQLVAVVNSTARIYSRSELELGFAAVEANTTLAVDNDELEEFLNYPGKEFEIGPNEFLENIRDQLPPKVVAQYNIIAEDRSAALWALECSCFRAGLSRYEVFFLARNCANNKFLNLRINGERELAKDVLRAERAEITDPKSTIMAIRELKKGQAEKLRIIAETTKAIMKTQGTFARGKDSVGWFVYKGQPIALRSRSMPLQAYLENILGLNYIEKEQRFVSNDLMSYSTTLPMTATVAALSHFDVKNNTLYLHTGRKQVLKLNEKGLTHTINGADDVIFPWQLSFEPFVPLESSIDWADSLFGDSLNDVTGLTKAQALALLRVWLLFILFRDLARAHPILAILGQPGSGKSAMLARVFAVFYGAGKNIGGITSRKDFDTQTSNFPLVVFDNVDTWESWLPDSLAQVVNNTDIDVRRLYTDNEIYSIKRQAMVALSAFDPKFGRADVADRLLILSLIRVPEFRDEASMYQAALEKRNYIWGAIVDDLLTVLRTPRFIDNSLQFRIQDFATLGIWISRALGIENEFRLSIQSIRKEQKSFILDNENMLVDTIWRAVRQHKLGDWNGPSDLWTILELVTTDPLAFSKRYRGPDLLARRLHTLQDALKAEFDIECKDGRLWRIDQRAEEG